MLKLCKMYSCNKPITITAYNLLFAILMLMMNLSVSAQQSSNVSIKDATLKSEKFIFDSLYHKYEFYNKKDIYDTAFDVSLSIYKFSKLAANKLQEKDRWTTIYTLGEAYYNIDSLKKAQIQLEKLKASIGRSKSSKGEIYSNTLRLLSKTYSSQGDYQKSIMLLKEAERRLAAFPSDSAEYSNVLMDLGEVYRIIDEDSLALRCFKKSYLILCRLSNLKIKTLYSNLTSLAYTYHDLNDCKNADSIYRLLLSFAEKNNLDSGVNYLGNKIFYAKLLSFCSRKDEAKKILSDVLVELQNVIDKDVVSVSDAYYDLGNLFYELDLFDSAIYSFRFSCDYLTKTNVIDSIRYLDLFKWMGLAFEGKNDFDSAILYYKKSIGFSSISNKDYYSTSAYIQRRLGICFSYLKNYKVVESCFLDAKKNIEVPTIKDWDTYSCLIDDLSGFYWSQGDTTKLFAVLSDFKKFINKFNPKPIVPLDNLVFIYAHYYSYTSQWSKAESILTSHSSYLEKNFGEKNERYRKTLFQLSELYAQMGDIKKSDFLKDKYLENIEKYADGNVSLLAEKLSVIANSYYEIGDNEKAMNEYRELSFLYKNNEGEFSVNYLNTLEFLAHLYLENDFLDSALHAYRELASEYKLKFGTNNKDYSSALNGLAVAMFNSGNIDSALILYKESLKIQHDLPMRNDETYALTLSNLGVLLVYKKKYSYAESLFQESVKLYKRIVGLGNGDYLWALNNLSDLFLKTNQIDKGLNSLKEMLAAEKERLKNALLGLTESERQLFWEKEKSNVDNILSYSISFANKKNMDTSKLSEFSDLAYNSILISKSLLLNASTDMEKMLKKNNDPSIIATYNNYVNLRKSLITNDINNRNEFASNDLRKSKLDSLQNVLLNKLSQSNEIDNKITKDFTQIKNNLSIDEAVIEFVRYTSHVSFESPPVYFALVLRPNYQHPILIEIGKEYQINEAVKNKNFSQLYNYVWKDLDSLLSGVKTVYYSPVGELNNVAFSALCFQSGDSLYAYNEKSKRGIEIESSDSLKQTCGNYLLDKYTLHQLTTTRYLADSSLVKVKPLQLSIDLYGGVDYDSLPTKINMTRKVPTSKDFALGLNIKNEKRIIRSGTIGKMKYLEGTRNEVSRIGTLFMQSKWKVRTFTNRNADEFQFKQNSSKVSPSILHIATHGFAFPDEMKKESNLPLQDSKDYYKASEDPMLRCGLMLSGSNISWTGDPKKMIDQTGEDGILTAAEVLNMDLSNTKLVVLSACETGLGKIEGTEGTFGLKRGFKLAGVEQIIVSLWSVPDNETMELMTLFYTDLAKSKDPVISFEKAQKQMRNKYPYEPEKWAGFVLVR